MRIFKYHPLLIISMPIKNGSEYIDSLRNRNLQVYLFGELVKEPVDHPMIRPSINAVAATYDLAVDDPDLGSTTSSLTGLKLTVFYILLKVLKIW